MLLFWNGTPIIKVDMADPPVVCEVIPFYIPIGHKPKEKWVPPSLRGKVLEFKPKEPCQILP